ISTITTYGIVFFLVAGTGFLAAFIQELYQQQARMAMIQLEQTPLVVMLLQDTNPVIVMLRILGEGATIGPGREMWLPYLGTFALTYLVLALVLILWSGWKLNPINQYRKLFRK